MVFSECNRVIDLVFLVDGSGSICDIGGGQADGTCNNWNQVRNFIISFIDDPAILISKDDARVAVVSFANEGKIVWDFNA